MRANKPFVVVNVALLDPQKYESELFGVENTNETINYGFFEKATDGTLLIDEVSEIPLETQSKILRVLIDQKFRRVNGVKEINVNYDTVDLSEIFKLELDGNVVYPDTPFHFELLDGMLRITGDAETFYDTTFIWAAPIEGPLPKEGKFIAGPFLLKPDLIPFNNVIQLDIFYDPIQLSDQLGIYFYNQNKSDWIYLSSELYSDSLFIRTSILSGEIFAVIEELNPPEMSGFTPYLNGTYYSSDLEHLSFSVHDTFAGIEGETDLILKLDGKPVVFEYNSYQKKVRFPLKYNLKKGIHTLYVQASDKVGNMSIVEGNFFIK